MNYGREPCTDDTVAKIKLKGQSIQKIEWKQMDRQTDMTYCITFPTIAVITSNEVACILLIFSTVLHVSHALSIATVYFVV